MVCIKPLPTKQLTSWLPSSSTTTTSLSSSSVAAQVHSENQQGSTTTAARATSICKRVRRRNGVPSAGVLFFVLLDLWGVVSIIVLITTTATSVSAVSIAAVSLASNAYVDSKGNGASGNFDNHHQQQQHHHQPGQPPQPHILSLLTGNNAKGNGSSVGLLNLSFGDLVFDKLKDQQEKEMDGKSIKNKRVLSKRNNMGDTRITSNQDVTTLALAVDNSSAVAIANINSSFNHVSVVIGPNAFPHRFDSNPLEDDDNYN